MKFFKIKKGVHRKKSGKTKIYNKKGDDRIDHWNNA